MQQENTSPVVSEHPLRLPAALAFSFRAPTRDATLDRQKAYRFPKKWTHLVGKPGIISTLTTSRINAIDSTADAAEAALRLTWFR